MDFCWYLCGFIGFEEGWVFSLLSLIVCFWGMLVGYDLDLFYCCLLGLFVMWSFLEVMFFFVLIWDGWGIVVLYLVGVCLEKFFLDNIEGLMVDEVLFLWFVLDWGCLLVFNWGFLSLVGGMLFFVFVFGLGVEEEL